MKLVHKILILFLAANVLLSTNGLAITIHTCFSKSTKKISVFATKDCCMDSKSCKKEKEKKDNLISKCCTSTTSFLKVNSPFETYKSCKGCNALLPVF